MEKKLEALRQIAEHFELNIDEMFFEDRAEDLVEETGSLQDVIEAVRSWHSGSFKEKGDKFLAIENAQIRKGQRRQDYYVVNIDNVNYWYED